MSENITRDTREQEFQLIRHLLQLAGASETDFPISATAHEYEGGKMGSINLVNPNMGEYKGDLIKVVYFDSDNTPVLITLTIDSNNQLLDLDFWKADFSKLLVYPTPDKVAISDGLI